MTNLRLARFDTMSAVLHAVSMPEVHKKCTDAHIQVSSHITEPLFKLEHGSQRTDEGGSNTSKVLVFHLTKLTVCNGVNELALRGTTVADEIGLKRTKTPRHP